MIFGMSGQKSSLEPIRHVAIFGYHDGKSKRWELGGTEEALEEVIPLAAKHPPLHIGYRRFEQNPYNAIIGDWHDDIVKVELDNCFSKTIAKHIAHMVCNRYNLNGFIILKSSTTTHKIMDVEMSKVVYKFKTSGYHIVWNRKVSKEDVREIQTWLCRYLKRFDIGTKMTDWVLAQCQFHANTLRIGPKGKKGTPEIVHSFGNQDKGTAEFLANREFILGEVEKMQEESENEIRRAIKIKILRLRAHRRAFRALSDYPSPVPVEEIVKSVESLPPDILEALEERREEEIKKSKDFSSIHGQAPL